MLRRQELEGFVEGLFGKKEVFDFPERAHRGLGALSEMWALFEGTEVVARDETKLGQCVIWRRHCGSSAR
jgi:hypothetical protein